MMGEGFLIRMLNSLFERILTQEVPYKDAQFHFQEVPSTDA